jgi:hypothetical protein
MNKKVCGERPPYMQGGKSYPTCGLTCAGILKNRPSTSSGGQNHGRYAAASTWSSSRRGSAPITSNPSALRNISAQPSQNSPAPPARSRSQRFNTQRAVPVALSHSRHFKTPPAQYSPFPPGRTISQSGGYTPQRNANQHTPLPHGRSFSQRSGGGGHIVPRNSSQGGTISQTQGRGSRYSTLPGNSLPCVVSVPQSRYLFCSIY